VCRGHGLGNAGGHWPWRERQQRQCICNSNRYRCKLSRKRYHEPHRRRPTTTLGTQLPRRRATQRERDCVIDCQWLRQHERRGAASATANAGNAGTQATTTVTLIGSTNNGTPAFDNRDRERFKGSVDRLDNRQQQHKQREPKRAVNTGGNFHNNFSNGATTPRPTRTTSRRSTPTSTDPAADQAITLTKSF